MNKKLILVAIIGMFACSFRISAQHGHLNVGAAGKNQNDPLIWENGADFISTSGYVKTLTFTNAGRFAGYYQGNITLTALPATAEHAGPDPLAPALGSYIQFRLRCLEGPAGGAFSFWNTGSPTPTVSVAPGETNTTLIALSESDGTPGSDPYGHFHGRGFTATKPGIYKIGFTAFDTSTNGAGGGPIHRPSDEITIWFQAGINIASFSRAGGTNTLSFGTLANRNFTLETSTNLLEWLPTNSELPGDDHLQSLQTTGPNLPMQFYRIKSLPLTP